MSTYVQILWAGSLATVAGLGVLVFYVRTRYRWAWVLAVLLLTVGLLMLSCLVPNGEG